MSLAAFELAARARAAPGPMAVAPAGDDEEQKPARAAAEASFSEATPRGGTDKATLIAEEEAALMAEEEAQALTHGIDVRGLRATTVIHYSTSIYPLQAAVVHCLRLEASETEDDTALLEALHTLPVSAQAGRRRGAGGAQAGSHWMHRWKQSCARGPDLPAELRAAHVDFDTAYVDFVRKVVLPNLADPRGILFQRRPTFRCHLAGGGQPTGRPHCDSEYGHQRGELNFWLPLTRVSGSNSLYAESAPGLADFAPFELEYGECQRFWGARCLHFTKANETPRTRVSFDFRVVPRSCHVERPSDCGFVIHGFYTAMDAEGCIVLGDT